MSIDLSSYNAVETALFVKLDVPGHGIELFSTHASTITIDNDVYTPAGNLLNVTSSSTGLRASPSEITITISGVPVNNVSLMQNSNIKSSTIEVRMEFFNPIDHTLLNISGNPLMKFKGLVTNYGFSEKWNNGIIYADISLVCSNVVTLVKNKSSGRRTNQVDFPNSNDMDNIVAINNNNYQFGVPQ